MPRSGLNTQAVVDAAARLADAQGLERMTLTAFAAIVERVISGAIGIGIIVLAAQGMIGYAMVLLVANLVSVGVTQPGTQTPVRAGGFPLAAIAPTGQLYLTWQDSRFIITWYGTEMAALVGIADLSYLRDRDGELIRRPIPAAAESVV